MPQNFLTCDRDQSLLLPPDLRDWLDEDHLAWFVIEAIEELDLEAFYVDYRADGHGRAAHDPKMMLTLLTYAYAIGERSSRGIERRCREDVAFRVITANQAPDHATIARFRVRHETALADLFSGVLGLCAEAGLVSVGVIALDGTKLEAAASPRSNRSYDGSRPRSSPRPVASTIPLDADGHGLEAGAGVSHSRGSRRACSSKFRPAGSRSGARSRRAGSPRARGPLVGLTMKSAMTSR